MHSRSVTVCLAVLAIYRLGVADCNIARNNEMESDNSHD